MNKLENLFFEWEQFLRFDYGWETSCEEFGCNEEGICRCGVIVDFRLSNINVQDLTKLIYKKLFNNTKAIRRINNIHSLLNDYEHESINCYFINRVLTINKIWSEENWNFTILNGYYGQEVGEIRMKEEVFERVNSQLQQILNLDTLEDKTTLSLKFENGFHLETLKGKKFTLNTISKSELFFANPNHLEKTKLEDLSHYKDYHYYKYPFGIVIKEGDKYRVIDGHHRILKNDIKNYLLIIAS
jgi:hypothetical protein